MKRDFANIFEFNELLDAVLEPARQTNDSILSDLTFCTQNAENLFCPFCVCFHEHCCFVISTINHDAKIYVRAESERKGEKRDCKNLRAAFFVHFVCAKETRMFSMIIFAGVFAAMDFYFI